MRLLNLPGRFSRRMHGATKDLRRHIRDNIFYPFAAPFVSRFALRDDRLVVAPPPRQAKGESREIEFSIILTGNGDWRHVRQCFNHLLVSADRATDLCVVTDGLDTRTREEIQRFVPTYRVRTTGANALREAAVGAVHDSLLFLSDSVAVKREQVCGAFRRLADEPQTGVLVGRIVTPSGALLEGGGTICRDAHLWYERWKPSDTPSVMFRREVDFGSADLILTSKAVCASVSGEPTPRPSSKSLGIALCDAVRRKGYRICYEPSLVGVSRRRQELFVPRIVAPEQLLHCRDRAKYRGKLLVIDNQVPHQRLGGGLPRTRAIISALVELGYFVTFYPAVDVKENWDEVYRTLDRRVEVMTDRDLRGLARFLQERRDYYDRCIISRPDNMREAGPLLDALRTSGSKLQVIYDAEAVFCLRELMMRRLGGEHINSAEENAIVAAEIGLARSSDVVLTVSQGEADEFSRRSVGTGQRVLLLPHHVDASPTPAPFIERHGLLFVGPLHASTTPNTDALSWFLEDILPTIRSAIGSSAQLLVAGMNYSHINFSLCDGADHLGAVEDLRSVYNGARVFIAPTRFSAGVPLKIYEASAAGVPVVATSLLARQLGWTATKDLLVADSASAFAAACVELYTNESLWENVRRNAIKRVSEDCSAQRFRAALETAVAHEPIDSATGFDMDAAKRGVSVCRADR